VVDDEKPVFRFVSTTAFRNETLGTAYLMRFFCFSSCNNHDASILSFLDKEMRCFCPVILPKNGHLKSSK